MQAVRVHEHGGPDALVVDDDVERPEPRADEVLVRIEAAGMNPVDTYFREGSYTPVERPFIPGVDFAGEVTAVGDDVETFDPGDAIFGTGIGNDTYHGSYAEYARVPTDRIVHRPDGVDPVQAGAAGVVGATAYRAIVDHGDIAPGDVCLVHGGSGGVGHVGVQLAVAAGADVITTANGEYADRLREYGADLVIPYDDPDLEARIDEHAPSGVDVVLDHKAETYLSLDARVAATDGRVVVIGEDDPVVTLEDSTGARSKDVHYTFMSMFNTPDLRRPLQRIGSMLDRGDIEVAIDRTYPLQAATDAHEGLLADSFFGKRVFVPE